MFLTGLLLPACAAVLSATIPAATARAEVHRCTAPGGGSIYTDKSCSAIGAIDRLPRAQDGPASASRLYRSGCSRTLQDLVYELTSAIDSRDVIGQAKGVIMSQHRVTADEAFAMLKRASQRRNRKLVDLAVEVAATGELAV